MNKREIRHRSIAFDICTRVGSFQRSINVMIVVLRFIHHVAKRQTPEPDHTNALKCLVKGAQTDGYGHLMSTLKKHQTVPEHLKIVSVSRP